MPLITDESGGIISSLFYDNVRDWQGYNSVNEKIAETLKSDRRGRFILMNNGVTIIARNLVATNTRFRIEDYQVVNGCQTSHVLFYQQDDLDDTVLIPVRIIHTQDENVIEPIIEATNRQTEVKQEQFAAITAFAKQLEEFFATFPPEIKLYYERRACQYYRSQIEKTRIVSQQNLVRAFASMFLGEPHRTIRSYKSLSERIGADIFAESHKLEPYFAAALGLYKLEFLFRNQRIDTRFRQARFQMLLTMRLLVDSSPLPQMNSKSIEKLSNKLIDKLSDSAAAEELVQKAAEEVEKAAEGDFARDTLHSNPLTEKITKALRLN